MKMTRCFKSSWFFGAIALAIVIGELLAVEFGPRLNLHLNPVTVAFVCTGVVAMVTSWIYEGVDLH
jgi:hypothetical protein